MESNVEDDPTNDLPDDSERNEIRSELSKMSFEDLKRLKDKLGLRVYKEAMFGEKQASKTTFKRANKNRPREVSSKIKPPQKPKINKETQIISDPRFNRLCGDFNRKHFQNTYGFLADMRQKEKKELKKMLKKERDEKKVKKIEYLIKRMDNQDLEEVKLQRRLERKEMERKKQIEALESGQKPHFKTKYEKKIINLVDNYVALKKTGKVENYIKKKEKKTKVKERKRQRYFEVDLNEP